LNELLYFGFSKDDNSMCESITGAKNKETFFNKGCHFDTSLDRNSIISEKWNDQFFDAYTNNCLGKYECDIPLTITEVYDPSLAPPPPPVEEPTAAAANGTRRLELSINA